MPSFSPVSLSARSALLLSCLVVLLGCKPKEQPGHGGGPGGGMPPSEVAVTTLQPKDLPVVYEYTGRIEGSREVEVHARVAGILLKRSYTEGEAVKAGQLLFTIDPAQYEAARARAQADVAATKARLVQSQRIVERLRPLADAKVVSQRDWEDTLAAEQVAKAELQANEARLKEANLNLSYTRVTAPMAGIAGRAEQAEGSLVSGPQVRLTKVTQADPAYVVFGISDDQRLKLQNQVGSGRLVLPSEDKFEVSLQLADGSTFATVGKMNFSDIHVDAETGTSQARAVVPNPKGALRPGQFVRVSLKGAQIKQALVVPQRAVLQGPQGKFVYVVNAQSQVEIRPVQAGDWREEGWVIDEGLKAGDRVVIDGVMKIGPGAPVKAVDAAEKPATAATPAPAAPAK